MIKYTSERRCIFVASKGQKFRKYSQDTIFLIVNEYKNTDMSFSQLSKKYDIPMKTINNWIYKYNNPNKFNGLGQKRGKKKESLLTVEDWKERYEILKKYQAFLKAQREKK